MRHRVLRGQKPSIPLGCRRLVCCHPPRASGRARRTGSKLGSQQSAHAIQGLPGRFENLRLNTAGPIPSVPVRAAHTHTCRLRPMQGAGQVAGDASLDADEQTCDCLRCRGRGPKARLRALNKGLLSWQCMRRGGGGGQQHVVWQDLWPRRRHTVPGRCCRDPRYYTLRRQLCVWTLFKYCGTKLVPGH